MLIMNNMIVKRGQSLLDIAILYCGNVSYCVEIAQLNNMAVSDQLNINQLLVIPDVSRNNIVELFTQRNQPATALTRTDNDLVNQRKRGIGFMQITAGNAESNGFITS